MCCEKDSAIRPVPLLVAPSFCRKEIMMAWHVNAQAQVDERVAAERS